jgi:hypothetical protein
MQEGILGRDFLKEVLGLDLKKIFEDAQTRAASDVVDTSDSIEFVGKTELSYLGVHYHDHDDDSLNLIA